MVALNRCALISRSCTTGWLDWVHGELWLCDDGLLRKSRGLFQTIFGDAAVRPITRAFTHEEILAICAAWRNRWVPWESIAQAELRGGFITDSLHVELRDGRRLKFLWLTADDAFDHLKDVLPRLLGPRYISGELDTGASATGGRYVTSEPRLVSRSGRRMYTVPVILAGSAVALVIAWAALQHVVPDAPELAIAGPRFAVMLVVSSVLAVAWFVGARRSRVAVARESLTVNPGLGPQRSVSLSKLSSVTVERRDGGRVLALTDSDGGSAEIGLGGIWEREDEILRLVADAARRTGASVDADAVQTLRLG